MTVYMPTTDKHYRYDFQLNGKRYSGSTQTADRAEAEAIEAEARASIRATLGALSFTSRRILKRAKTSLVRKPRVSESGYVYMLKSDYFIKIGHSHSPIDRIRKIQTATPGECKLLFVLPGSQQVERQMHAEFQACHYRGEWFFLCGALKSFVNELEKVTPERAPPRDIPPDVKTDA